MHPAVLINTWNQVRWLESCLQSVVDQVPSPSEVVVHDDGSEDGTDAVLRRWEGRVQVIRSKRDGNIPPGTRQGLAIERSLNATRSGILFLLDGDDQFLPGKIATFLREFEAHPDAVLVQSPLGWMDEHGNPMERILETFRHQEDPLACARATHSVDYFYPTSALAVTRSMLEASLPLSSPPGTNLFPDTLLSLQAMLAGKVVTLDRPWGLRRIHRTSDSAIKQRSRLHLLRQTIQRTRAFNHYAAQKHLPPIQLWRNRRFYLQLAGLLLTNRTRQSLARFSRD